MELIQLITHCHLIEQIHGMVNHLQQLFNYYYLVRGELQGLGPVTINLNIDAKTNVIDVNNILT